MTEQDFFNEHEQDAQRFSNFIRVVIVVIGFLTAMMLINIY